MSTTTIRIAEELKTRVNAAAERAGKTAHAFILDAITETVMRAEMEAGFHRVADARWAKALRTGRTIAWEDAKTYLEARAAGKKAKRPGARHLGR